ncbi:sensor histidine kinase [Croceicoccus naphthovorans]|uniref:histidine kinase n=1 Tax=Croceicoccus naphthovorans TaxID=1348774 RepID=A0A0G3XDB5_9SPHN|nr:histidine kinase dimerization/phosphoacceptor domain -containing protein [Croceicoccus naphthovorans]AKM09177.1 histidine kinase [Croceicoccus naphthovorans]MBB3990454.1 two-component sensor histidine kinase [Croceicoccus naphthovorans]
MHRLATFDVSSSFESPAARLGAQALFGLLCARIMIAVRSGLDTFAPTSGPFALVYPTVLIATLFGHWRGGMVAYLFSLFWAWWFVLPTVGSFQFEVPTDPARVAINALAVAIIAVLAEAFRRAVQTGAAAREAEIERRGMLMVELEHRTKNNFALVASLLELQKRRSADEAVVQALDQATGRVHTFARAYSNLVDTQGEGSSVEMDGYLSDVCARVTEGAFHDRVDVTWEVDSCTLRRQVAVAIGLFVNEALTNCAKYAFPDGREGRVEIRFTSSDADTWSLTIRDNGIGAGGAPTSDGKGGMGAGLMQAFARQAMGQYSVEPQEGGHCVRLASGA